MVVRSQLIAVDTNVLMDLADDREDVWDAIETIRNRVKGAVFVATSTVIQELAYAADEGDTPEKRDLAAIALTKLDSEWGFKSANFVPVGHGITEITANKIRSAGLLPEEEVNDSLIIAEAALGNCTILLSSDAHISGIDQTALSLVLGSCDINKVLLASPAKIVRDFFQKQ
jgi:predicted nucleic acid-binding protein